MALLPLFSPPQSPSLAAAQVRGLPSVLAVATAPLVAPSRAPEPSVATRGVVSVGAAQALAVPTARLAQMTPLPAVQTLLPPVLFAFTAHSERASFFSQTRYHLGSSFALVQNNALILPLQRSAGVLNLLTSEGFCVHAGAWAGKGFADHHAVPQANLEATQLVVGPSGATLLLWHDQDLTALHLRNAKPGAPWELFETTVPRTKADEGYLLPRPGCTALAVGGHGASARIYLDA